MKPCSTSTPPSSARRARWRARPGSRSSTWRRSHTTVSVERATLRLAGLAGADPDGIPWVNRLVDAVRDRGRPRARRPHARSGTPCAAARPTTCSTLAQKAASGSVTFRLPEGRDADPRARRRRDGRWRRGIRDDRPRSAPTRERLVKRHGDPKQQPVDLPHRRHRRHLRGHPAGPGGRPRGRRRHRGHPLHRAVAARLRARGRHPRGLRRHLRHPGELPADAGRARRVEQGARPLRPADQLRLGPVHARDRRPWPGSSGST